MRTTRACNSRRNKRDNISSYSFMEQVIVITLAIVCTIALFV